MGRKGVSKTTVKVTTTLVQRHAPQNVSQSSQQTVTNASARIMNDVEELLKWLEGQPKNKEETSRVINRLQEAYKLISIRNKVDSKRDELLSQDVSDLQRYNSDAGDEIRRLQEQYRSSELKAEKLENLSKVLTSRVKSIESKANEDVKAEKEDRLRLSYEFSAKIKDISVKLDHLGKQREQIITENSRLKQLLKACFDEFNNDPELLAASEANDAANTQESEQSAAITTDEQEQEVSTEVEGTKEIGTKKLEPGPAPEVVEKESADEAATEQTVEESAAEQVVSAEAIQSAEDNVKLKRELYFMEAEDDVAKIKQLKEQEDVLKQQSAEFMDVFDSFQQRLTESNRLFKLKQGRVEEITKEIKSIERSNHDTSTRIADCAHSTKGMNDAINKLRQEKEKYQKLIDKQKTLIDVFQADIANMEGKR